MLYMNMIVNDEIVDMFFHSKWYVRVAIESMTSADDKIETFAKRYWSTHPNVIINIFVPTRLVFFWDIISQLWLHDLHKFYQF